MPTDRHRECGQQRLKGGRGGGSPTADESGAAAPLELVILAPLLMLLVVFVLWAGRGGQAVLVADLAAGEAAVAAAVCCEDGLSANSEREEVVHQVLSARPNLDFLCIGGVRPAVLREGGDDVFVDEAWLERFAEEVPGRASGVGVIGVRLECETDGAVAPLRGIFPTVSFYGQAAEVVAIPPRLLISIANAKQAVSEGDPGDDNKLVFEIRFSAPNTQRVEIKHAGIEHKTRTAIVEVGEGECCFKEIEIPVIGDEVPEGDEILDLELVLIPKGGDPCAPRCPRAGRADGEKCRKTVQRPRDA